MGNTGRLAVLIFLLISGCAGIQTSQDYDPATDFTSLRTFAWASPTQPKTGDERIDNPFRDTRIREAIREQLTANGYRYTAGEPSDFLVRYTYTLRQRLDSSGASTGIGFGIGSYGRHGGIGIGTGSTVREVDEGTLVIDLITEKTDALLWRGSGTQRFVAYDDPKRATKAINALVESILKQFPPEG